MARVSIVPLLLAALALLVLLPLPASAQTLLVSSRGASLQQPLKVQGVDVGATIRQMEERLVQQQRIIDVLLKRNSSNALLLQQYEQRFEQLQQTVNNQQTLLDAQEILLVQVQANSTIRLPGNSGTTLREVVTEQQTILAHLVEQNNTVIHEISSIGEHVESLDAQDQLLAEQLQQLNATTQQALHQHDTRISELTTLVDALLTPTVVHAEAGSEQAAVKWALASATVTAEPGGATCETDGLSGEQQCTVLGLTNGVNYTFTARLRNAAGVGGVSPASNSVAPRLACRRLLAATAGDGGVLSVSPLSSTYCAEGEYTAGTVVTLTAIPDSGHGVSWSGPASGVEDSAALTFTLPMPDAVAQVVASFALCYALTVDVLSGSGSASIADPLQSAGCAAGSFVAGASVTLKASPAAGWSFNGWSGSVSAGFGAAVWSFVMPAAAALQCASFAQCMPLTVSRQPADGSGGSVSVSPSQLGGCPTGRFLQGAALTLTATPVLGWALMSWTGAQNSTALVWSYTMGNAAAVQVARFGPCLPLTLLTNGTGSVSVDLSNSPGCPAGEYVPGASLTLNGAAPAGWTQTAWTGTVALPAELSDFPDSPWSYTMPAVAATQTAHFAQCYPLTLVFTGTGAGNGELIPSGSFACDGGSFVAGAALGVLLEPIDSQYTLVMHTLTAVTASGEALEFVSAPSPFGLVMPAEATTVIAQFTRCIELSTSTVGGGSITSLGNSNSYTCAAGRFPEGEMLTIIATPDANRVFAGWTGTFTSNSPTYFFVMPATASTLTANFAPCFALSITVVGTGSITRTPVKSSTCATGAYIPGANISVVATATGSNTFVAWSGASTESTTSTRFVMPSTSTTLTATFAACYVLTLTSPSGGGSVAPSPSKSYACATGSFVSGANMTLTATPDSNFALTGWIGAASGTTNPRGFTMPGNAVTVGANFAECYPLTLQTSGSGSITASIPNSPGCAVGSYVASASVTLTGTGASSSWTLTGWTGTQSRLNNHNAWVYTMPAGPATQTAQFAECYPLALASAGGTTGTVASSPTQSFACATGYFVTGAALTITGTAGSSTISTFREWSGDASGTANPVNFTMPAATASITGTFVKCVFLSAGTAIYSGSGGSIGAITCGWTHTCNAASKFFPAGASMTIEGTAAAGSTFTHWSSGLTSTDNPLAFTMPSTNLALTANFYKCYALFIQSNGNGTVSGGTPASAGTCAPGTYGPFVNVTVTATPNSGFGLVRWTGPGATGNALTWTFTTRQTASTLAATFGECFNISVSAATIGGTVGTPSPSNSPGCAAGSFVAGTSVNYTATPSQYYRFTKWSGLSTATTAAAVTVVVLSSNNYVLQAHFEQIDFVYGQLAFTQSTVSNPSAPAKGFARPFGVAINAADELFVADFNGHRVLVYPYGSLTPSRVIGQADFTSTSANRGALGASRAANTLYGPAGLAFDADGNLLVSDQYNYRVLVFPPGASSTTAAIRVYGQLGDFTTNTQYSPPTADSLAQPTGVAVGAGGVFIADSLNFRVLYYPGTSTTATRVIGQTDFATKYANGGMYSFHLPRGIALDASGGIYVTDNTDNRITYYAASALTVNQPASQLIGQSAYNAYSANRGLGLSSPAANSLYKPQLHVMRPDGLYVADAYNGRVLRFPLSGGVAAGTADRVWGQVDFITNLPQAQSNNTFIRPYGVAFDSKGDMYVSDSDGFRVLRVTP